MVVDDQIVRTATGDNSESLDWHTWELGDLQGSSARIVIIDTATGGWGHICADHFVLSDSESNPAGLYGSDFAPLDARVKEWSDWLVSFRLADGANHFMDVTMGHGLPYTWVECENLEPRIVSSTTARYFDESGTITVFPVTGDRLGIEYDGKCYGIYAPEGTIFDVGGNTLAIRFAGEDTYIAVGALVNASDLVAMQTWAYAVPRDTRLDWEYDIEASSVTTTWTVSAEALRGTATDVLQGWLPHHYRGTTNDLVLTGPQYRTPRGTMKCATGNQFSITYSFPGILPNLPAPEPLGNVDHDFDPDRLNLYLTMYAGTTSYGADTYWGGKDVVRLARYMNFAHEAGNDSAFESMRNTLRTALVDWYTYSPEEVEHYFAFYPSWGALVGFNESYYSYSFTDHHFHYGYHTMAAALLGMYDQAFLADYGPMATLVAKEYANWDRTDTRFPFLRTFDPWRGHSYAGGLSSPNGNNQESSSEAIQSWAGLFLLGNVLDDEAMRATGAMGYVLETAAITEYWQDYYGYLGQESTMSDAYDHTITGILFDDGQAYATYFSGDPAWIYGIQWLPISPAMNYLAKDPVFAEWQYDQMMTARDSWLEGEPNTISQMGTSLGNVVLGYRQLFDPDSVAAQMDALWTADDPVATDNYTGGITYYFTHANRLLGPVQWDVRINMPASQAYTNSARGETSYVIYNPEGRPTRLAHVSREGELSGYVHVPPHELVCANQLLTTSSAFEVLSTWPGDGEIDIPAERDEIAIVFSAPVDTNSLAGVTLEGAGVSGLSFQAVSDELIVVFSIEGALEAGEAYAITVPESVSTEDGSQNLGSAMVFSFTVAEDIPEVLPPELVAHYRLNETTGMIAVDSSGSGLDGTYVDSPGLAEVGAASGTGTSVSFDGATQEVSLGSPAPLSTLINDFTVSMWIQPDSLGGNRILFGNRWHDQNGWTLRLAGNQLALERLGPAQTYNSGATIVAGQWTHVAAGYDAANDVTFYLNGQAVTTITGDSPASIATEPWFIASNGTAERFAGRIDDVQVYRRSLSASDVAFVYANPGRTLQEQNADIDANGLIEGDDLLMLLDCMGGPDVSVEESCNGADLDADEDVDLRDAAILQAAL